jgi:hypothetical protein
MSRARLAVLHLGESIRWGRSGVKCLRSVPHGWILQTSGCTMTSAIYQALRARAPPATDHQETTSWKSNTSRPTAIFLFRDFFWEPTFEVGLSNVPDAVVEHLQSRVEFILNKISHATCATNLVPLQYGALPDFSQKFIIIIRMYSFVTSLPIRSYP